MKDNILIIKNVDASLVNNIDSEGLLEYAEGSLIDNYLFMMEDNDIFRHLIDDQILKKYNYVYVLETYKNPWSSVHKYVFTTETIDYYDEIFLG